MGLRETLRMGSLGGFTDERLLTGDEDSRREAREELRREQRLRVAMRGPWPELPRDELTFSRRWIEHTASGALYQLHRGDLVDEASPAVAAFFLDANGAAVFLERPSSGPRTRRELDERRGRP